MIVFNNVTYILHVREGDICVTTQRGLLEEGKETIQINFFSWVSIMSNCRRRKKSLAKLQNYFCNILCDLCYCL